MINQPHQLPAAGDLLPVRAARSRARVMALIFVPLALFYFAWLLQPDRIGNPLLYGILVVAELFNFIQALGFWWTCSNDPGMPSRFEIATFDVDVDVLIPVYDEPVEVVEPTVAAAAAMRGARVHVALLDDGDSPDMEALAHRHGVSYVRRIDHSGAKAGNLNHALATTTSPFVAVFDCDHVVDRNFLSKTLPRFSDKQVAYVQTPQFYANARQSGGVCAAAWAQQALFFGPISRGKHALGAMFCCGTNMVFRRSSLEEIGGFPEDSLTEDFEMSVALHERGHKSVYVPEVLARGLGPEDMASYASQQHRWARGCLAAIPKILGARLPRRLRLQYLLSAMYFLTGWSVLVYVMLPVARLLTGAQPLAEATADQFLLHFAPYFGLAILAVSLFGRGYYSYDGFALMSASFWVQMRALIGLLLRRRSSFAVTPKKGAGTRQPRAVAPTLVVIAVLVGAAAYGLLQDRHPATWNNVAFAMLHAGVLLSGAWPALTKPAAVSAADPRIVPQSVPRKAVLARPRHASPSRIATVPRRQLVADLNGTIDGHLAALLAPGRRCALLDFPNHSNVGDAAIWLGTKAALARRGVEVAYACDRHSYSPDRLAEAVGDGPILLHGGGNLGDLYPEQQSFREEVVGAFSANQIVQLPQSIHFRDGARLQKAGRTFDSHPDLTLMVRDETSLAIAQEHFEAQAVLCPDLALALGDLVRPAAARSDVLWLGRTDDEAAAGGVSPNDERIVRTDWTTAAARESRVRYSVLAGARASTRAAGRLAGRAPTVAKNLPGVYDELAERSLRRGARILAGGHVVVTDRLHGHILSLLLGIPHVVLPDANGKVRNFFTAWTEPSDNSLWCEDPSSALDVALELQTRATTGEDVISA